ncbi:hypothetical protein CYK37_20285 [Mesorhizobium loti]|nr:DUF2865 domain-containing protein [Mesorhizobium loti]PLP57471.1 hypothetical protein CYK37_20285 [Mesorhizobium loti]
MTGAEHRLALAWTLFSVIVLALCSMDQAEAASRICRQLRAELASLQKGGGAGQQRRYDGAIARQNNELAKARAQARDAGCGFSLFGGSVSQCAALNAAIDRMNVNLDKLQRKRSQMGNGSPRRDRGRLLAALDANECDGKTTTEKPLRATRDEPDSETEAGAEEAALGTAFVPSPSGEFRTMCVRTCDGYFFPMSNAATASDFQRDQNRCEAGCPGTEMQVFYSRGMAGDPATMSSSRTGRPYSELPAAFLYKRPDQPLPQGCGCNAAQNFKIIAGNPPAAKPEANAGSGAPFLPTPTDKPDPAEDPETQANASGHLDAATIRQLLKKPDVSPVSALPPEQRKIRVVGPTFLPAPEAAIDLQAPAPKQVR